MNKDELINGYFEGALSQNQLEEFNRLLKADSEFVTEFEFQKELKVSLKKEERKHLKAMFNDLNKSNKKPETKVLPFRTWLAAASIVIVGGLASWFFYFNAPKLNANELYAANFTPYDNIISPIERGGQDIGKKDLRTKAFTAYEIGEYPEALELFKELKIKNNHSYIDFYSAIILMQLNKQEEAIPLLKKYIESNAILKDRALWYLALSHLKVKELDKSKLTLKKLISLESFKTKEANELLEKLD